MKKFFIMLGCWFLALLCIFVGSELYDKYKTSDYDTAAVPYLEQVVPQLSQWDVAVTRSLMAPEALDRIPEQQFTQVIAVFSKLGDFKSMATPKFSKVNAGLKGDQTIVEYTIDTVHEQGDAVLTINLLVEGDRFSVYHFNLSSEALGS